jgi:hypothetical protein
MYIYNRCFYKTMYILHLIRVWHMKFLSALIGLYATELHCHAPPPPGLTTISTGLRWKAAAQSLLCFQVIY